MYVPLSAQPTHPLLTRQRPAKSRRAVQTKLINDEINSGGQAGGVPKWLSLGIDIQQLQYVSLCSSARHPLQS